MNKIKEEFKNKNIKTVRDVYKYKNNNQVIRLLDLYNGGNYGFLNSNINKMDETFLNSKILSVENDRYNGNRKCISLMISL